MARPKRIELGQGRYQVDIPILYEDRSVIAIDKPAWWMLVPFTWQRTQRNLQAAITSSIIAGDFWATCRNLTFLKHIHRLDAETTGILLFARSQGALETFSSMFESRRMEKTYLAVVLGTPKHDRWSCDAPIGQDPTQFGRMIIDPDQGRDALTHFEVLETRGGLSLVKASPVTGRTHQIRVHLADAGHPILGDPLYGPRASDGGNRVEHGLTKNVDFPMGLRAVHLGYTDPFRRCRVEIHSPQEAFLKAFGFKPPKATKRPTPPPPPNGPAPRAT